MTDDADLRDVAFGWRIWFTDGTGLFPPTTCRDFKATRRVVTAWCPTKPAHEPPVTGCTCGLYCLENLVDALYRLRVTHHNLRTRTPSGVCFDAPEGDLFAGRNLLSQVPVLSRVAIFGARLLDRVPDGHLFIAPELRAAAVCIEQLFVTGAGDACPHFLTGCPWPCRYCPEAERIAESLSSVLGLRAVIGLPSYSYHDWENRSDWCKQLGPQGVPDPFDDVYISWFRNDEPVVPFTAPIPAPGHAVAGEEVCADVLRAKGVSRKRAAAAARSDPREENHQ